ncbi:MAG: AMIN domain-containing protein [Gemmatimonadota bacterium]|nr:AMIN domain-containing protein [Gemmatimonadota bacterium]
MIAARRLFAPALVLGLAGWTFAGHTVDPIGVTSLSVVPATGRAQVVIGVTSEISVSDFTLGSPHRLVIDLNGAVLDMNGSYDRIARGGITNIRYSQFKSDVVRVVIELDGQHPYEVRRSASEVRVSVDGGTSAFEAWHSNSAAATRQTAREADPEPEMRMTPVAQQSTQPRITVTYQDADIRDVIAAFATFAGRTIVVGKDVSGTVTAEIRNQPWDVALRAILEGQGLAAAEDAVTGIITVDSYANIQNKQAVEPLVTRMVPVNYANAAGLAGTLRQMLARDCQPGSGVPQAAGQNMQTSCVARGAIVADTFTNSLLITESASRMGGILEYLRNLDIRTPQVAIKAKIIFVNRSDIEDIGISYDIGTRDQFFTQLVGRTDPSTLRPVDTDGDGVPDALGGGTPVQGDRILLGGNALSAIANANSRVTNPALSLVFSTALGKFSLTAFLDALQEVRLADLQAEPSIVTLNNRKAEIAVGQEIPIRILDAGTSGAGGAENQNVPRATVQLKEVGIILGVTPQVTNNRQILLTVHAENSDAQLASSDVGFIFNRQRADNQLLVNDGETAVIGGLTVTQVSQSKSGIPFLVNLPMIGRLFGQTRTSEEKRDLLILITPHIVDEGEQMLPLRTPGGGR